MVGKREHEWIDGPLERASPTRYTDEITEGEARVEDPRGRVFPPAADGGPCPQTPKVYRFEPRAGTGKKQSVHR